MHLLYFLSAILILQDPPPYKASDEFEIKLAFEFKQRPSDGSTYKVHLDETRKDYERRTQTGVLPYLFLNLIVPKINADEVRIKVTSNLSSSVLNKKLEKSLSLKLDLGFTDDIKDHVSAYHYTILFLSASKSPVSKIEIYFEEDGTYLVNGEKRGKI